MNMPTHVQELAVIEKMSCSDEEKRALIPLLKKLVALCEQARRDGILAIESSLATLAPPLLRRGLEMAVDAQPAGATRRMLYYYAVCGGAAGKELFENILIMEGVMMIQNGDNPRMLKKSLPALFGENMCDEIEAALKEGDQA